MEDKKIKHFIFTRFFCVQRNSYPYNVLDVNFLKGQLPLAKNMLSSLENQTNKNFELVFLMNPKFPDDPKYEFIFTTLQNSTTLPLKFIKDNEMSNLVKAALNDYDFVIQSRMDFDDFIFKGAVADTQSKINECENILSYGYCKGYTYVYKELYPDYRPCNGIGHYAILQSIILNSSFAKRISFINPYNFDHAKVKPRLKEFLEKNNVEFQEHMFQQNMSVNAYIYFRHEFSRYNLVNHSKMKIPPEQQKLSERKKLTTEDITKKQLEEEFGFFHELNSIK